MSGAEGDIRLIGIAVDQRSRKKRMRQGAHFVIHRIQHLAGIDIDNMLKTVLLLAAFL